MAERFGFIFATEQEANPFHSALAAARAGFRKGAERRWPLKGFQAALGECEVAVAIGGIGAGAAIHAADFLAGEFAATWLIATGVSGALWSGLRIGDVLQASSIIGADGSRWPCEPLADPEAFTSPPPPRGGFPPVSRALHQPRIDLVDAVVYSSDRVLWRAAEKSSARGTTHADAVDMESASVARVARERQIHFSCLRSISDDAEQSLPLDFNRFVSRSGGLHLFALGATVAFQPWKLPGLLRLARQTKAASSNLARVLIQAILRR